MKNNDLAMEVVDSMINEQEENMGRYILMMNDSREYGDKDYYNYANDLFSTALKTRNNYIGVKKIMANMDI